MTDTSPSLSARSRVQRERIVAAAIELMAEGGERSVSLSAAARRAGVARGTVYYHFRDRASLLSAARGCLERELLKLADGTHHFRNPYGLALRLAAEDDALIRSRIHRLLTDGARNDPRTRNLLARLAEMADEGALREGVDPVAVALIASALDLAGLMAFSLTDDPAARREMAARLSETWRILFEQGALGSASPAFE